MPIPRRVCALLMFSFVAVTACGSGQKPAESPASEAGSGKSGPAEVGKPAPDLAIHTLNGQGDVKLEALSGKVVLVDFWATWCAPCKQSFPVLEAMSKRHGSKLAIVGVSVNDDADGVAEFAKEMGATFPVGWDKGHAIAERWNVSTMPSSFLVDEKGTVRFVHAGYHDGEEATLDKEIDSLIGSGGAPANASAKEAAKDPEPPAAAAAPAEDPPEAKPAKPSKKKATKKKRLKKTPKSAPQTS
jgi:thiol-disulfide isomerase/thioredoxin